MLSSPIVSESISFPGLFTPLIPSAIFLFWVRLWVSALNFFSGAGHIGSGTVLDTARLKYELSEHLSVDSRSIHAFIIGEHGDSEIAAWSSANISGIKVSDFCEMRGHYHHDENTKLIAESVKNSAYEIIEKKHATYYGIAMAVKRICEVIIRDEKSILPISSMMHGEYGIDDVVLSMPAVVGKNGVETTVPIDLNEEEQVKLRESAETLKRILKEEFH